MSPRSDRPQTWRHVCVGMVVVAGLAAVTACFWHFDLRHSLPTITARSRLAGH